MKRILLALSLLLLCLGGLCSRARANDNCHPCQPAPAKHASDYPADYPFGKSGDAAHPDGYDGTPGGHLP